jgi:hypothetical protein
VVGKPDKLRAGLDFFFDIRDALTYLRQCGHQRRSRKPIKMIKDLTAKGYSIDKFIHELVLESYNPWEERLEDLLIATGWQAIKIKTMKFPSLVYVPHWLSQMHIDEESLSSFVDKEDYFRDKRAIVEYLKTHGNMSGEEFIFEPAMPYSRRRDKSREEVLYPDTPLSQMQYLLTHGDKLHRADTLLWDLLRRDCQWMHVNVKPKLFRGQASIYLAPWAVELFETCGRNEPAVMVPKRDYFYDTQSVFAFIRKFGNMQTDSPPTPEDDDSRRRVRSMDAAVDSSSSMSTASSMEVKLAPTSAVEGGVTLIEVPQQAEVRAHRPLKTKVDTVLHVPQYKSKKPKLQKREVSLTLLDPQMRQLAIDLFDMHSKGADLRSFKVVYTAARTYGMRWFSWMVHAFENKVYTFTTMLRGVRNIPEFIEGRDYWINEDAMMAYIHSQLALLGYVYETNTVDETVTFQRNPPEEDEVESDISRTDTPGYSLRPPLDPHPRRDGVARSGSADIDSRYVQAADSFYMNSESPSTGDPLRDLLASQLQNEASFDDVLSILTGLVEEPWSWDKVHSRRNIYRGFDPPADADRIFMRHGVTGDSDPSLLKLNVDFFFDPNELLRFLRDGPESVTRSKRPFRKVTEIRSTKKFRREEGEEASEGSPMSIGVSIPVIRSSKIDKNINFAPNLQPTPHEETQAALSSSSSFSPVAVPMGSGLTLRARVDRALKLLQLSCRAPVMVARDMEYSHVYSAVRGALDEVRGQGVYLCGMSGVGKTATVENVVDSLQADAALELVYTRICGTGLSDTGAFSYIADLLGFKEQRIAWNEAYAEAACMRHFVPTYAQTDRKGAKTYPCHLLFIDEIDKAPRNAMKTLYEACAAPNSRLVLVGAANDFSFPRDLHMSEEKLPVQVIFPALAKSELKAILLSRTGGLIDNSGLELLSMKAFQRGGDARLLLGIGAASIEVAASKPTAAIKLGIPHHALLVPLNILICCR